MSVNLLELMKEQVSEQLAKYASNFLGANKLSVSGVLDGAFPVLLGSIVKKGRTVSGAEEVLNMIRIPDQVKLNDIAGIFQRGEFEVNRILSSGGAIIDVLLGNNTGKIIDYFVKKSGLGGGTISSLFKLAAPFLLRKIDGVIKGEGVSVLMELLEGQKEHLASVIPSGLSGILGISDLLDNDTIIKVISPSEK